MTERELATHAVRLDALEKEVERLRARMHALVNDHATVRAAAYLRQTDGASDGGANARPTWDLLKLMAGAVITAVLTTLGFLRLIGKL